MVEAALVTPVVFAMLFGIIEFGMMFKDYLSVQAMVRNGVRTASAMPRNANFAQATADQIQKSGSAVNFNDVERLYVYKANATNTLPSGKSNFDPSSCSAKCVSFHWDKVTKKFVKDTGHTWDATTQNACSRASGGTSDRIGVYAMVRHNSLTGIIGQTHLAEASAMYLEPFPALVGCAGTP